MQPNIAKQVQLRFHHIGCLSVNILETLATYSAMGFNNVSEIFTITNQKVKVCFVETAPEAFIEFIEPIGDNPTLQKILKSGNSYYHVGYTTPNIDRSIDMLEDNGFRLVNTFYSEAFHNKRCAFMYSPEMHLIELIESTTNAV
jgi:methylmalonyl-CoA/ethylmalonyl-CoA epimerase